MERMIKRHGLGGQVNLWGLRRREEIPAYLTQTDLFVLPSTREGFGLAVLEARTAGVPVVAMNHGGVSDIIQNGVDGFLTNNYTDFADKITEFICNEKVRDRLKRNAETVPAHLMWYAVIARHLEICRQAIAKYPERVIQIEETNEGLLDRRYGT